MLSVALFIVPLGALFIMFSLWGLIERHSVEAISEIVTLR
jgi:hypothetical protein